MPRPGPRPYECTRRAWHSDRHQPIRGSLIQELLRVVNEIHSPATRKNKEWQEKLPVVVLKVEEIMYSKANSEAEYIDPKTLWDRVNDAVNTIIRLDESTETGQFLQPCIEAALNLGCMPRRTSRSQRHSNLTSYLSSGSQGSPNISPSLVDSTSAKVDHTNKYMSCFSSPSKSIPFNLMPPASSKHLCLTTSNNNFQSKNFPSNGQFFRSVKFQAPNSFSVYPLYYGSDLHIQPKPISRSFDSVDTKIIKDVYSSCDVQADMRYNIENPCNTECDLSLRLGPLSVSCPMDHNKPDTVGDIGFGNSRERSKFSDWSSQLGRKRKAAFSGEEQLC